MLFILLLGFVIRLIFIPMAGFKADMAFWKGWGLAAADKGIIWLTKNTNYNYPPGFAYILALINKIYALFANPYAINSYWNENNLLYLFLFKSITIIADIVIVFLIIKIIKIITDNKFSKYYNLLAILYFFNPVSIFDGAVWGQVDQFGLALLLLSIYLLLINKDKFASVIFTLAWLMKMQNIIFIPLFYIYIYKKYSFKELIKNLIVSFLCFWGVTAPFWLSKEMGAVIKLYTANVDYFPHYSLNAFNIWWIVSGLKGMQVSDKNLILGVINAKTIGLISFIFTYFIGCVILLFSKREELIKKLIIVLNLIVITFFHLLTQSHERYLFPLIGLLLILFAYIPEKERKNYFIFYSVFSLLSFLNIYFSMFFNYSDQVIWPFTRDWTTKLSLVIAMLQIATLIYFIAFYVLPEIRKQIKIISAFGLILLAVILIKNLDYILYQPISLTALQPINYTQDYLFPIYDRNLNSYFNPFSYDRLSSNYYFYNQGIASHANSMIVYGINNKFSRLRTDYGIDTEGATQAEVFFSIYGNGRELFSSKKMGRFDNPESTEVNIKGVNKLILKIESANKSIYGAHADWLGPVLVK